MDTSARQPATPAAPGPSRLGLLVAGIVLVFVAVAAITGMIARRSAQASAGLAADVEALQKQVESLRSQVNGLRADSERTVALSLADRGYFPLRTNAGTLLVAVAGVDEIGNGLRVSLRVGNPHAMTYLGFTLAFAWDKGKGQQAFREALAPGTWIVVPVLLAPADRASTRALTITSASVDEIPAR